MVAVDGVSLARERVLELRAYLGRRVIGRECLLERLLIALLVEGAFRPGEDARGAAPGWGRGGGFSSHPVHSAASPAAAPAPWLFAVPWLLTLLTLLAWLLERRFRPGGRARTRRRRLPRHLKGPLQRACHANDAPGAMRALMQWERPPARSNPLATWGCSESVSWS